MTNEKIFRSNLKTLGLLPVGEETSESINGEAYRQFIKVLFLPENYTLKVDLKTYAVKKPSLFFVSPDQYLELTKTTKEPGCFIFYNRDFYCIQIHDEEVACNGLLFNNIHNMPMVALEKEEVPFVRYIFNQMEEEFVLKDASLEEMIRTYLKQLFIRSARLWKKQHLDKELVQQNSDLDFFRKFTLLVEAHYKQKHNVADYAELLYIAPKTITHKFKRLHLPQPNDIIKNRIILEAKRLLVHTTLTAKQIGYELGYEDPAYFSRIFVQKTGETLSGFRTKFLVES